MIKLDRVCRGIVVRIRERLWVVEVNDRSRSDAGRNDKSLDTEPPDKAAEADSVAVSLDIPLIPGQPERFVWHLDHKKIKIGIGGSP